MADDVPPTKRARMSPKMLTEPEPKSEQQNPGCMPKQKHEIADLLTLNPDCMLNIFEFMDPIELCNVVDAFVSMHDLVKYHFRLKHKQIDFDSLMENDHFNIASLIKLFQLFGDQMISLNMSFESVLDEEGHYNASRLFELANQYCQNTTKNLKLFGFCVFFYEMKLADQLFASIETLMLDNFNIVNVKGHSISMNMDSLKVLKMHSVSGDWTIFMQALKFPQLEEIELCKLFICNCVPKELIGAHTNIKRLSITHCYEVCSRTFSTIGQCLNLETLEFQMNGSTEQNDKHENLMELLTLKKLTVLKLDCDEMSVTKLIDGYAKNGVPIEHLELANGEFDLATAKSIAQLKSIKILKFNRMFGLNGSFLLLMIGQLKRIERLDVQTEEHISESQIIDIVRDAIDLKRLSIDAKDFTFGIDMYTTILATMQKRSEQKPLEIHIYGDSEQLPITDKSSIERNKKWLSVKKLNRDDHHLFPINTLQPDDISDEENDESDGENEDDDDNSDYDDSDDDSNYDEDAEDDEDEEEEEESSDLSDSQDSSDEESEEDF